MFNTHNKTQKKLKKIYEMGKGAVSQSLDDTHYIECKFHPSSYIKFEKKQSNKQIRKLKKVTTDILSNGNHYRKVRDIWWNIY